MSDDKLHETISRASRAAAFVNDPLFKEAIATIERDLIKGWKETPVRDTDARERLWHGVQMVGHMAEFFRSAIDDGKIAQARLEELNREKPKWEKTIPA